MIDIFKHTFFLIIFLIFLSLSAFVYKDISYPHFNLSNQETKINIKSNDLKSFTFGYSRLISSLLWIETLLESDIDHYKGKNLNSWMFLRFKAIIDIDPNFYQVYKFGGQYLSIIKDDDYGAKYIYDKALELFPVDLEILYNSAFHYYFELQDLPKAFLLYKRLQKVPFYKRRMPFLDSLLEKLETKVLLNKAESFKLLKSYYSKENNQLIKRKYLNLLYDLKESIDLECLNKDGRNCDKEDLFGNKYKVNGKKFESVKEEKFNGYLILPNSL